MPLLFLAELQKLGNAERALADQRYHKSKRVHWGVTVPQCAQLLKIHTKTLNQEQLQSLAESLWATDIFDPMVCATRILGMKKVQPGTALWQQLIRFLESVDGWALEDGLAHAAWKCLLADEGLLDAVETWTTHDCFWIRRAALVYTLPFAKKGRDPERMLQWASLYAKDPEWFIQKAIGWWLRVLGAHDPERVMAFLKVHGPLLKSVAKKEATRKLLHVI